MAIMQEIETKLQKGISVSTDEEVYYALLELVKDKAEKKVSNKGKKKLYYISAEFLIGKLLSNNLINLGIYDEVKETLEKNGKSLAEIEEIELEPSLGNGGLGRLAACFIDSIATLGLNGDGVGLNYHYGLFKQVFENNLQKETPNPWITKESWLTKTDITYPVSFGGFTVQSRLYDIDVVGYNNRTTKLHLFDIESVDESIVGDTIDFDKDDIKKNLTLFLYPDDSDDKGRLLRVYQQYFMVSNAARLILAEAEAKGSNLHDLADYAAVQINDTHPSMVIPELIRLLQEKGILMDEAIEIVSKVCAYTNHTILAEALEKWPISFLEKAVPQLMPIIRELDNKVRAKVADESTYIIKDGLVHMAHMDIHFGYSVNGVAYLHTEILKNTELNNFYKLYPEKFNNKTNGITFRRWLMSCNPELSAYITELIGDGWKKDANELEKLGNFINDDAVLTKLVDIKNAKKTELASYLKKTQNLDVPDNSIFDIQVKRLHEYKRQLLNAFSIMTIYFRLKDKKLKNWTPTTFIFGAKAAPGYARAKAIIKYINEIAKLVNNDPETKDLLQVYFISNYNVSYAEKIVVAADLSEQTSTAGLEASGTGNMKFMLNGAPTLGTLDGANVEIAECAGIENEYIFGAKVEDIERMKKEGYHPKALYDANPEIKRVVDTLIDGTFDDGGAQGEGSFKELHDSLLKDSSWQKADNYFLIYDLPDYVDTKIRANTEYANRKEFGKKCLINIANAGKFSSDRTILQYAKEIWHTSYKK